MLLSSFLLIQVIKNLNTLISNLLARFLIAGIVNTIVGFSLGIIFLTFLPFHFSFNILLATCFGVIFNYFLSLKYVFKKIGSLSIATMYFTVYFLMYLLNIGLMFFLINQFNLNDIIAYTISMPLIIGLTYILQKKIVFSNEKNINNHSNI